MPEQEIQEIKVEKRSKRKKNTKGMLHGLFLFVCVFVFALLIFFFLAKSYSPNVDVAIGNTESMTLNEEDMDVEIKSVDERLKWIQMEDELPSVSVRNPNNDIDIKNFELNYDDIENDKYAMMEKRKEKKEETSEQKEEKPITPPKPSMNELIHAKDDFRKIEEPKQIVPLPIKTQLSTNTKQEEVSVPTVPTITKVYLGQFATLEEAMSVQDKVAKDVSGTAPFIKAVNDYFIVQLGSFTDKTRADNFIQQLKEKGYTPKVIKNN
ncbi:SPOR domain-containing protein [bacterium]|nr:SPOR domain-containing protein [bacterium]